MKYNKKQSTKTINLAGGVGYSESPKLELISLVLTSFMKDKFYETENDQLERIKSLVSKIDPLFVAKLAIYARKTYGMRSVSHVLAGEIAKRVHGVKWTRLFFQKVVNRPDDMGEILGYYFSTEKKLSNPLRDGFAKVLESLDEYTLAKYKGEGKKFKMVDIVNLTHPKSTEAISKLIKGKLKSFDTWESKLSEAGSDEELKGKAWRNLVMEKKIGYFALLRNLRNIIEQSDAETLKIALELLVEENRIKKSLVLPFRFLTAIKEIQQLNGSGVRETLIALSKAIEISLSNIPNLDGETLVVVDSSGSMTGQPAEIASVFASALYKKLNSDLMLFSDDARYVSMNPSDSLLTLASSIPFISGGTNFHSIFQTANKKYDRIIILSDMQGWIGYGSPTADFNRYKKEYDCNPFVYSFDLQGYGQLQFPESNVFCLAGFSEKVFDTMKYLETDKNALINEIDKVEI